MIKDTAIATVVGLHSLLAPIEPTVVPQTSNASVCVPGKAIMQAEKVIPDAKKGAVSIYFPNAMVAKITFRADISDSLREKLLDRGSIFFTIWEDDSYWLYVTQLKQPQGNCSTILLYEIPPFY